MEEPSKGGPSPSVRALMGSIVEELNERYDDEVIRPGEAGGFADVRTWVPSKSTMLNLVLSDGQGLPMGRIIELFGDPGDGKSTILQELMIAAQQQGGYSALLDVEHKWPHDRGLRMGHDDSRHFPLAAHSMELGFGVVEDFVTRVRGKAIMLREVAKALREKKRKADELPDWVKATYPKDRLADLPKRQELALELEPVADYIESMPIFIAWDSITASMTELEHAEVEDPKKRWSEGMVSGPRKVRQALRRMCWVLSKHNATLAFSSQTIANIGGGQFGPKSVSATIGSGVKFHASIRLQIDRIGKLEEGNEQVGIVSRVRSLKNQICGPFRNVDLCIRFDRGLDDLEELFRYLEAKSVGLKDTEKVISKSGAWYYLNNYPSPGQYVPFMAPQLKAKAGQDPGIHPFLRREAQRLWTGLT